MAMIGKFYNNAKDIIQGVNKGTLTNPTSNSTIGFTSMTIQEEQLTGRQAVYPQWFFSARLGQPRGIDTEKLRTLAKSAWVQMVLNAFKKQIYSMEYRIVPIDENDEIDYSEQIKQCKEFFEKVNNNGDRVNDVDSEIVTDLGEIDAATYNFVYTSDSYDIGELPIYDVYGRIVGTEPGLVLKPLGQRELTQLKTVDASSILKQVDIHKNLLNYWQYSFKHPRQNPTPFSPDEISYVMLNKKSYSIYGFSPVQSIQQILELLIQGTRYNKDIFKNNAVPDMIATLPKLPTPDLKKLKRIWNTEYKGKPHQVGFLNWPIENLHKLAENNRDLEWLEGQKWYFKICFAVFGVSPTEAGFFENSNKSNDEGQERVTVRNALRPFLKGSEKVHTTKTIPEILQTEKPGLKFEYVIKDDVAEKIEFDQDIQELNTGTMTINEFRKKNGREPVEWGDEPLRRPFGEINDMFQPFPNSNNPDDPNEDDKNNKSFSKSIEEFIENGR